MIRVEPYSGIRPIPNSYVKQVWKTIANARFGNIATVFR